MQALKLHDMVNYEFWRLKILTYIFKMFLLQVLTFISFFASSDFCRHMLITFANSLDPDQNRQYDGSDLDPNQFDTIDRVPKIIF